MKDNLLENSASNENNSSPELILTDWLTAVYELYSQFEMLNACIHREIVKPNLRPEANRFIGQCPAHQLITLSITIQSELQRLIQEMDQLSGLKLQIIDKNYQRLVSHTSTLKELSQQAQAKLYLTTLPRL
ncbi:hypothetical protein [Spirosoma sp.]|uniref:hypothetical protein n=1 Tax=Spirosoma sp. TaxID=1899569 RepID=UPI003B3AD8CC